MINLLTKENPSTNVKEPRGKRLANETKNVNKLKNRKTPGLSNTTYPITRFTVKKILPIPSPVCHHQNGTIMATVVELETVKK